MTGASVLLPRTRLAGAECVIPWGWEFDDRALDHRVEDHVSAGRRAPEGPSAPSDLAASEGMTSRVGWVSSLGTFVATDIDQVVGRLAQKYPASADQVRAWRSSVKTTQDAARVSIAELPPSSEHGTVLEYELPAEGGRRPDVIILKNGLVVVIEFKQSANVKRADIDQVAAYARDLTHYHEPSHDLEVVPVLVRPGNTPQTGALHGVHLVTSSALGALLVDLARRSRGPLVDLDSWVAGAYRPMPALVHAARLLFEKRALPEVRAAMSAGVPATVQYVLGCAREAAQRKERRLVLLTGVPGAGKTLVGLQVVHDASLDAIVTRGAKGAPAAFLSGNGPLVTVLRYAISGRRGERSAERKVFVRDMHAFIREHAFVDRISAPDAHVLVFDEAQRAWDAAKMRDFHLKRLKGEQLDEADARSEPELLLRIAARLPDWCLVVALVGSGQEIHTGEEAGIEQWADAARAVGGFRIHGPETLGAVFSGLDYTASKHLTLDTTLRSHVASDIHVWARSLLDEAGTERCNWVAQKLEAASFPIFVTRSLEDARAYVRARYAREPDRRFGLIGSSKATNLKAYDLDPTVAANYFPRIDKWFCEGTSDEKSGCRLDRVASEFLCQGLELDMPIVCWGTDLFWEGNGWRMKKGRPGPLVRDPKQLRRNAYRVLLTRGRDGMVIWVPPEKQLDETAAALTQAGARALALDVADAELGAPSRTHGAG
jgi:hypothetical protein